MYRYIIKRLLLMIPVLLGVTVVVFAMLQLTPGDPAATMLGADATPEGIADMRAEMGLDDPAPVQFVRYIRDLLKGDLGISYATKKPVTEMIAERLPTTLTLAFVSVLLAGVIGVVLGVISATKQYTWVDSFASIFSLIGVAMPNFWLGLVLILLFSVKLGWLPATGFYGPSYWVLPAITIGYSLSATITRQTRSSMLETIRQDYLRTARAKGQKEIKVIVNHALKNALIPIVTVLGMQFGGSLGGAVLTESIFSIPGIGKLMVEAIRNRDYPMVQGGVLFIAIAACVMNLLVDILYAYIDPRIKSQYGSVGKVKKGKKGVRANG